MTFFIHVSTEALSAMAHPEHITVGFAAWCRCIERCVNALQAEVHRVHCDERRVVALQAEVCAVRAEVHLLREERRGRQARRIGRAQARARPRRGDQQPRRNDQPHGVRRRRLADREAECSSSGVSYFN